MMSIKHKCFAWHLIDRDLSSTVEEEKAVGVGLFWGETEDNSV